MINEIKKTINSFSKRGGFYIFLSNISLKAIQFVLSVLVIRLLTKEIYGEVSYAFSIIRLIIPFSGAGLFMALLHFGGIQKDENAKKKLFSYTLKTGSLFSIVIIIVLISLSEIIGMKIPGSAKYIRLFCIYIFSYHLFHSSVTYFRIKKNNKAYAVSLMINALLVLILCLAGISFYDGKGYAIAYGVAPAITAVIVMLSSGFLKSREIQVNQFPVEKKGFIKYGLHTGLGSIASQMAWQLDTIMLGLLLSQSTLVAEYKAASLIPFSLIFIPTIFMQTDFVYIAEKKDNKKYLIDYYKKYIRVFFIITIIILGIWYLFGSNMIKLLGSEYIKVLPLVNTLMINVVNIFLFRAPLGNMLAAVGKAKWNSYSAIILLIVNLILNYVLIPIYGIFGAAYATIISITLSSLVNLLLFIKYLRKLDAVKHV